MRAPTKKRTVLAIAAVLSLGCIILISNHPSEPTYQGRPLTKWLEDIYIRAHRANTVTTVGQDMKSFEAAHSAVIAAGTNAIPSLLSWLTYKDSPLKTKMLNLLNSQSLIHFDLLRDSDRHLLAGWGFVFLGTNVQPAFADLVHISQSSDADQKNIATQVSKLLFVHGKPPLPLLVKTLQDPRPDVREEITNMIINFYPEESSKLLLNKTNSN